MGGRRGGAEKRGAASVPKVPEGRQKKGDGDPSSLNPDRKRKKKRVTNPAARESFRGTTVKKGNHPDKGEEEGDINLSRGRKDFKILRDRSGGKKALSLVWPVIRTGRCEKKRKGYASGRREKVSQVENTKPREETSCWKKKGDRRG